MQDSPNGDQSNIKSAEHLPYLLERRAHWYFLFVLSIHNQSTPGISSKEELERCARHCRGTQHLK